METIANNQSQELIRPIMLSLHHVRDNLREIEEELSLLSDKDFFESVAKGGSDINTGKCTTCKTKAEVENFFNSI